MGEDSDFHLTDPDTGEIRAAFEGGAIPGVAAPARQIDIARLESVLQDLVACRQLLDLALRDG
jgi:hypothetical protein